MAINFGDILGGLGAAYGGRAQEYAQGIRQREQGLAEQRRVELEARQRAMYEDANTALQFLANPELTYEQRADNIIQLAEDRLDALSNYPDADPSDTLQVLELARQVRDGTDPNAVRSLSQILVPAASIYRQRFAPQQEQAEYTLSPGQRRMRGDEVIAEVPETEELGFEIMTAAEVAAIPGLDPTKAYKKNLKNNDIVQIGGGGPVINVGTATESERTAGILANRLDFAQSQINDILSASPESESPAAGATALSTLGLDYLARLANPAERQIVEAAQMDMLDAALTLGTGAAYTREQLEGYRASYFPQIGDDPRTVSAKAQRLNNLVSAAYEKAGRAAPESRRGAQATVPQDWLDSGLTQQDWDALPDNEKQVFLEGN